MKTIEYVIKDRLGIHARPAGLLVKKASEFSSDVTIYRGEKMANCKKIFALMGLCVRYDEKIRIEIEGSDEAKAADEIKKFLEENL